MMSIAVPDQQKRTCSHKVSAPHPRDERLGGFHCPDTTIFYEHSEKTHLDRSQFNINATF